MESSDNESNQSQSSYSKVNIGIFTPSFSFIKGQKGALTTKQTNPRKKRTDKKAMKKILQKELAGQKKRQI
jgi:hypothetical protein